MQYAQHYALYNVHNKLYILTALAHILGQKHLERFNPQGHATTQ